MSEWRRLLDPGFVACTGVLVFSALSLGTAIEFFQLQLQKHEITVARQVHAMQRELPSWTPVGPDRVESAEILEELETENYLNRMYRERVAESGRKPVSLDLHLAYYTGMIDTVPHVPERCLVGGGWVLADTAEVRELSLDRGGWREEEDLPEGVRGPIFSARLPNSAEYASSPGLRVRLPRDPEHMRIRVVRFAEPTTGRIVHSGYLFIANGGTTASAEGVRLLAFDYRDYYAYYLKVQLTTADVKTTEEFVAAASSLLGEALPEVMRCVPDWVEVESGNYPADNPRRKGIAADGGGG